MVSLSTAYFPNTVYFSLFTSSDTVELEHHESFQKQSFRNRTRILNIDKPLDLIIPVKKGTKEQLITETEIEYKANWRHQHWGAIKSAYGRSPFFEYYQDEIKGAIYSDEKSLFKFNLGIIKTLSGLIGMSSTFQPTNDFELKKPHLDLRNDIHPKKSINQEAILPYNQHFGNEFVGSLSVLDLLFNEGPQSLSLLKQQRELILNELN